MQDPLSHHLLPLCTLRVFVVELARVEHGHTFHHLYVLWPYQRRTHTTPIYHVPMEAARCVRPRWPPGHPVQVLIVHPLAEGPIHDHCLEIHLITEQGIPAVLVEVPHQRA